MGLQLTKAGLEAMLLNTIAEGVIAPNPGILAGAKALLFTNIPIVGPRSVLADLTEPAYTGYARQTITWIGPYATVSFSAYIGAMALRFTPTAAVVGDLTITGWGIVPAGATPTILLALEIFAQAVSMTGVDTPVIFSGELLLPSGQVYGAADMFP